MALGARASALMWSVLRRALVLMSIGVAIGTAGALALTRVMAGLLYEIRPTDAVTFAGAAMLLAVLAVAASPIPAWRATRVDPLIALRNACRLRAYALRRASPWLARWASVRSGKACTASICSHALRFRISML
jgi:predicted lysophospholipase L1 biosynthesis ABC-type transport system permease subunit